MSSVPKLRQKTADLIAANLTYCKVEKHFDCVVPNFRIPDGAQDTCLPDCDTPEFTTNQMVTTLSHNILLGDVANATKKHKNHRTFELPGGENRFQTVSDNKNFYASHLFVQN